jgi:hypothetical protein
MTHKRNNVLKDNTLKDTQISAFRKNAIKNKSNEEMKNNSYNALKNNTLKNNVNNMNEINHLMNDSASIDNAEIKSNNANQVNPGEMDCGVEEETNINAMRNENESGTSSQEHLDMVKCNDMCLKQEDANRLVESGVQCEDKKISYEEFIKDYYTTIASKTKKGTCSYYDDERKEKINLINYDNMFVTQEDAARLLKLDVQYERGEISREEFVTKRFMLIEEIRKTLGYIISPNEIYPDDYEEGIEPGECNENDYSDCSNPSDKYHAIIMMATDKLDEYTNGDPSGRNTVLNVLSNKISLKEASQLEELFNKKATMCGIGSIRVRDFLSRKSKEGDKAAVILWLALNIEDRRISSLVSKKDYFSSKVISVNQTLKNLIKLIRKTGIGDYGYINTQYTIFSSDQDSTCRTLYIELPGGIQISFTVPSSYRVFLKPYEKEILSSDKSNLVRIEEAVNKLYGKEMLERYGSSPAAPDVVPANLLIRKHNQYVEIFERLYPNYVVRNERPAHKAIKRVVGNVPAESGNSTNSESKQRLLELVSSCDYGIIRLREYDYLKELKERYDNNEIPRQQYYFMKNHLLSYIDHYYCYNGDGTPIRVSSLID